LFINVVCHAVSVALRRKQKHLPLAVKTETARKPAAKSGKLTNKLGKVLMVPKCSSSVNFSSVSRVVRCESVRRYDYG